MRVFQSSSFKLVCAFALLANALPHKQGSNGSVFLTLYGNKKGDINNKINTYPEVELTPTESTTRYNVVGKWTGDKNNETATALRDNNQDQWAETVYKQRLAKKLLAAGYDKKRETGWWTISSANP